MSEVRSAPYPVELYPGCPCHRCDCQTWDRNGLRIGGALVPQRMSLCPTCGNKRCPGSTFHEWHGLTAADLNGTGQ